MNKLMVQTEGLTRIYPKGNVLALEQVNLTVEEGDFVAILGPSGAGKTTLLNIIGALDKPTSGKVIVDGFDLSKVKNLARFRAERVGFVFQLHNLIPTLTAWENVQIPLYALGINAKQRRQKAMELLEAVGLKERIHHIPAMLSGGERQRVALARSLSNSPSLVLADEPIYNIDRQTGKRITDMFRELNKEQGVTFIVATHNRRVAAAANSIVHLVSGNIVSPQGRRHP